MPASRQNKTCSHCKPYLKNPNHYQERFESFLLKYGRYLLRIKNIFLKKSPKLEKWLRCFFFYNLFKTLGRLGLISFVDPEKTPEKFSNRILLVINEAKKRNIKIEAIKFANNISNLFRLILPNGKIKFFEGLPTNDMEGGAIIETDDKWILKRFLKKHNFPYAEGKNFNHIQSLNLILKYGKSLGFSLVVKPRFGSLSQHVTTNIQNITQLNEAIKIAKKISYEFIIEKHVAGDVYRAIILDGQFIACAKREPPNVVGDGKHALKELIEIKNQDPRRGELFAKNYTLHKINYDTEVLSQLKNKGITLDQIIPAGEKIYLSQKVILAAGADIIDVTDKVDEANKKMFIKLAGFYQTPLIGIDFICQDIAKPYYKQTSAIIEINSLPFIDMHHFPVSGKIRNVAKEIVNWILKNN